jgi:hypothetical protein
LGLATPYRDFSLFRIYADKKTTVQQNIQKTMPYTPKHFLPISDGVAEDDFTLVLVIQEKPTNTSVAIEQIVNELNPAKLKLIKP